MLNYIIHSAKGSTWKNHKYKKKVGQRYYYKDDEAENGYYKLDEEDYDDGSYDPVTAALLKNEQKRENEKKERQNKIWRQQDEHAAYVESLKEYDDPLSKAYVNVDTFMHTPIRELVKNAFSNNDKIEDEYETTKNKKLQHSVNSLSDFLVHCGFDDDSELYSSEIEMYHSGILGQKWGVKNGPPYPIPTGDHSAAEKKANKYRNIDGSLNERGIDHRQKYIERQTKKNNRKYQHYIDKYNRKAEKAEDKETKDYYIARRKNAEAVRDQVNEYFKKMGIDEIAEQEQMQKEKALKTAGTVAGAVGAAAVGVGVPMLVVSGAKAAASFLATVDPAATLESLYGLAETPMGKKAVSACDTAIRAYSDVRSYAFSIYADQTISRLNESGVVDKASAMLNDMTKSSVNSASAAMTNAVNTASTTMTNAMKTAAADAAMRNIANNTVSAVSSSVANTAATAATDAALNSVANKTVNNVASSMMTNAAKTAAVDTSAQKHIDFLMERRTTSRGR